LSEESVEVFRRIRRLFFLHETRQDLLLLANMRLVSFPKYSVAASALFATRQQLMFYEAAIKLEGTFAELLNRNEVDKALQILNRSLVLLVS
jgi:hypothetical protein